MALVGGETWEGGFVRQAGALVTVVDPGAPTMQGGFARDADGRLAITGDSAGATVRGGFLRSPAGVLVATVDPAGATKRGGFLLSPAGAVVITTDASSSARSGHLRSPAGALVTSTGVTPPVLRITTTGATFNPTIELAGGSTATASWTCEETLQTLTGVNPTFSFGSAATRHVTLALTKSGNPAPGDVVTFNLGFNNSQDGGRYNMGPTYDKATQAATAIENIRTLYNLLRFAAANGPMAGTLDFTGCASLQYIECYDADVQGVVIAGCTSLLRLNVEFCNLQSAIDLNDCAATFKDLRAASQQGSALAFVAQRTPLATQYHQCIHDQAVTNRPKGSLIPVVEQEWIWNIGEAVGAYPAASSALTSLEGYQNSFTSAALANRFTGASGDDLDLRQNKLRSVALTGDSGLTSIQLDTNQLNQAAVDVILATVASWGTSGGLLGLTLNTAPSAGGLANRTTLVGRGWTVNVDASAAAAPANTVAPAITGVNLPGNTLIGSNGTWTGLFNPADPFTYQWKREGSAISGATGATYVSTSGDVGHLITFSVTGEGVGGTTTATSSAADNGGPSLTAFSDDFESASFTGKWNTPEILSATASIVNDTTSARAGSRGMHITTDATGLCLIRHVDLSWTADDTITDFWIKLISIPAATLPLLVSARDDSAQQTWQAYFENAAKRLVLTVYGGSAGVASRGSFNTPNNSIVIGQWHHVVVRHRATVDGRSELTLDGATPVGYVGDLSRPSGSYFRQLQMWGDQPNSEIYIDDVLVKN